MIGPPIELGRNCTVLRGGLGERWNATLRRSWGTNLGFRFRIREADERTTRCRTSDQSAGVEIRALKQIHQFVAILLVSGYQRQCQGIPEAPRYFPKRQDVCAHTHLVLTKAMQHQDRNPPPSYGKRTEAASAHHRPRWSDGQLLSLIGQSFWKACSDILAPTL